jgi:saccharopine dehydrogenase-like NADP-dependent oxidoreductase
MEITGLDEFQRELSNLQHAIESLDGTLATLNFDAADPDSVNEAIRKMEAALDSKAAPYRGNATITSLIEEMKEKFRQEILERAKAEQK